MAIIFGKPIAEVKKSISYSEYMNWIAYRKKYGPMNDVRRYDRPAALLATVINRTHGGKLEMSELMPYGKEEEVAASLTDLINAIGGVNKVAKHR